MAKKKQAAKTAAPPAPTTSLQSFEAEIAATLNDERTRVQREIYHLRQDHHHNGVYDEIMKLGREEGFLKAKEGFIRTLKVAATTQFEKGKLEGFEEGRAAGKAEAKNLRNEETAVRVDSTTQTTPAPTVDAVAQTTPLDEPTATLLPPLSATSAQPPSTTPTTSSTTTTTSSPASKPPPAPAERRHWLPCRPTAPQLSPRPLFSSPEPHRSAATSLPTTAATPSATTSEATTWATASTQTASTTWETANQAVTNPQRRSVAQQTAPCDYEETRSSERVICSTKQPCQPHHPQQ